MTRARQSNEPTKDAEIRNASTLRLPSVKREQVTKNKEVRIDYQLRDEGYRFPPGSDVWHAVDVAVERIIAGHPGIVVVVRDASSAARTINGKLKRDTRSLGQQLSNKESSQCGEKCDP